MNIDNELRKKLSDAGSLEEVEDLLQGKASEEEVRAVWKEICDRRAAGDIQTLDDDELEAVAGGWIRDYESVGCFNTVRYGSNCAETDACFLAHYIYYNDEEACLGDGERHVWSITRKEKHDRYGSYTVQIYKCTKCGRTEER